MAELDAQLRFDIDQALRDINEIERALDRAIAPIEIEVDTRQTQELESTLREVERIAARASTETASIDLAAGRAEANFEDLARALGISEAAARDLTTEVLQAQSAANRLEDATRDVARQLGLSDREAERLAGSLREADRAADAIDVTSIGLAGRFAALRTSAAAITGALAGIGGGVALGAAIVGANAAIQSFARLEDSINAVNVVFGDAAGAVLRFGETAAASAGLSQEAFNQAVVPIGSLLQNFGFDAQQAADGAVVLVQRAADLASVMGGTVQDALLAVGAALRGEADPLERYGASISAARVESFALAEGLAQTVADITPAITLQARYGLILQDTAKVSGDFAATSGDLANAQRTAGASVQNFVTDIGESLAPALESILVLLPEVLEGVRQLVPGFAAGGDSVAAFFESAGEGGGFRTEFAAVQAGFQAVTAGGGVAVDAVQALSSVLTGDLGGAFEQVQSLGAGFEEAFTGGISVQLANDLDKGVEAVTAFGTAIGRTAQQSGSFDLFADSYRGFAIAANLSTPQLRTVTTELIKNASALGLTAPEVKFLREQLALLTNALDPNVEALRQQAFEARNLATAAAEAALLNHDFFLSLEEVGGAAAEAGLSMLDLLAGVDPVARSLFDALSNSDQMKLALQAIGTDAGTAAVALDTLLRPAIINASDALIDFNENGKVSLNEFIRGIGEATVTALQFQADLLAIFKISPEVARELLELPPDVAAELARAFVENPAQIVIAEDALIDPVGIAKNVQGAVLDAINLVKSGASPQQIAAFTAYVTELDIPGGTEAVSTAIQSMTDNSFDNLIAPDFTPVIVEAVEGAKKAELQTAAQDTVGFAFEGVDVTDAGFDLGFSFMGAVIAGIAGQEGKLQQVIVNTLDGAIQRQSPPKLFLDAGVDSGEAFWSGFQQADLQLKVPTPAFSGSIATGSSQTAAGVGGGGGDVIFNLASLDTRDADTTIARAGQIGGQVVGILNGRFHL